MGCILNFEAYNKASKNIFKVKMRWLLRSIPSGKAKCKIIHASKILTRIVFVLNLL